MAALRADPTTMPDEAPGLMINAVEGKFLWNGHNSHVIREFVDYAAGQLMPDSPSPPPVKFGAIEPKRMQDAKLVLRAWHTGDKAALAGFTIDWQALLTLAMQILNDALAGKFP